MDAAADDRRQEPADGPGVDAEPFGEGTECVGGLVAGVPHAKIPGRESQ